MKNFTGYIIAKKEKMVAVHSGCIEDMPIVGYFSPTEDISNISSVYFDEFYNIYILPRKSEKGWYNLICFRKE